MGLKYMIGDPRRQILYKNECETIDHAYRLMRILRTQLPYDEYCRFEIVVVDEEKTRRMNDHEKQILVKVKWDYYNSDPTEERPNRTRDTFRSDDNEEEDIEDNEEWHDYDLWTELAVRR